mgnify:FL=1
MNKNKYEFKYRNKHFFKLLIPLYIILYLLTLIVLYKYIFFLYLYIPASIAVGILILVWIYIIKPKAEITKGSFEFFKNEFYYTTLNKTRAITYKEVEYIKKEEYTEKFLFFKKTNYRYIMKIINAGTFYFPYYDASLDRAMELLNDKIKNHA